MKAIVCMTPQGGIGYRNKIPWKSKLDLQYFREITEGNGNNAIVMGRKTFQSMNNRPLPRRRNYIMTKDASISNHYIHDVVVESNVQNIALLDIIFDDVFIIGGAEIYSLFENFITTIYVTYIETIFPCDRYFPINLTNFKKTIIKETVDEKNQKLVFCVYYRIDNDCMNLL
jgi:dihydrofolate reductase